MSPHIERGDYVVVNRWAYRFRGPARGDVVVVRDPEAASRYIVKRISQTLPDGRLELTGENAARSRDSRSFGPIRKETIVGKVWLRLRP